MSYCPQGISGAFGAANAWKDGDLRAATMGLAASLGRLSTSAFATDAQCVRFQAITDPEIAIAGSDGPIVAGIGRFAYRSDQRGVDADQ